MATTNMSPEALQSLVRSLERSVNEIAPPTGAVALAGWHVRRYLPFYALLMAWILAMWLLPLNDGGASAASASAPPPAAAAEGSLPAAPGSAGAGSVGGISGGAQGAAGFDDAGAPVIDIAPVGGEVGDGDGDEGGDGDGSVGVPEIEESVVQQLAPFVAIAQELYNEGTEVWALTNEVFAVLAPVLVEAALALGPGLAILLDTVGPSGELREACETLGLAGTAYGAILAPALPPVNLAALLLPAFIICGFIFDEVPEDAPAPILDNVPDII